MVVGAFGVLAGFPLADPIVGLAITVASYSSCAFVLRFKIAEGLPVPTGEQLGAPALSSLSWVLRAHLGAVQHLAARGDTPLPRPGRASATGILRRLMDAIPPELVDTAEAGLRSIPGVRDVEQLRLRRIGHHICGEVVVVVVVVDARPGPRRGPRHRHPGPPPAAARGAQAR